MSLVTPFKIPAGILDGYGNLVGAEPAKTQAAPPPPVRTESTALDGRALARVGMPLLDSLYAEFTKLGGSDYDTFVTTLTEAARLAKVRIESNAEFGAPAAVPRAPRKEPEIEPLVVVGGLSLRELREAADGIAIRRPSGNR